MIPLRQQLERLHDWSGHNAWRECATEAIANRAMTLPELFDLLSDSDSRMRGNAVSLLAWFKLDDEIASHVRTLADEPDADIRLTAGMIFLDSNDAHYLLPLLEFLVNDRESFDLWMGVAEYVRKAGLACLTEVLTAMSDQRPEIRRAAAGVVQTVHHYLNLQYTPPELIALMTDDDHKVRQAAIWAIRNLKDYSRLPNLIRALEDNDPGVQYAARVTIDEFTNAQK